MGGCDKLLIGKVEANVLSHLRLGYVSCERSHRGAWRNCFPRLPAPFAPSRGWRIVGPWGRPLYKSGMSGKGFMTDNAVNTTIRSLIHPAYRGTVATEDEYVGTSNIL